MSVPAEALQLRSLIKKSGELELSLAKVPVPEPGPDEVLVRIEATPINPSDLGLLLGPVDPKTAKAGPNGTVVAPVPDNFLRAMSARLDQAMPVGNEGAGTVVKAGAEGQALVGKLVAVLGGSMYSQYRLAKIREVMPLPAGATAADGASCFVNPLTALAMTEVMRMENHKALIHTAAASNLGQMLNKICIKDGISLINVVRSDEQTKILRDIGARHIVDSSKPSYMADLVAAITETGATLAFDALGGGKTASQLLTAMEAAAVARMTTYSRYGSDTFKQVYIYGGLDTSPTELTRGAFGFSWSLGGFLLTPFLQKIGRDGQMRLRQRVTDELKTTFASHYTRTISLKDALNLDVMAAYTKKATGEKFLINPNL